MDERARTLERRTMASGDPVDAAALDASRRRSDYLLRRLEVERLLRELQRLGEDIRRSGARERKVKAWHKGAGDAGRIVGAGRRVSLRWLGDAEDDPFSLTSALMRRWRRVYREWLRESGVRAERDGLLQPEPRCEPPDSPCYKRHNGGPGFTHYPDCPSHRTAVFLTALPRSAWARHAEWMFNSRVSMRAAARRKAEAEAEAEAAAEAAAPGT